MVSISITLIRNSTQISSAKKFDGNWFEQILIFRNKLEKFKMKTETEYEMLDIFLHILPNAFIKCGQLMPILIC